MRALNVHRSGGVMCGAATGVQNVMYVYVDFLCGQLVCGVL